MKLITNKLILIIINIVLYIYIIIIIYLLSIYKQIIKSFFFHSWEEEEADRAKAPFPPALPEVSKLHVEIRRGL